MSMAMEKHVGMKQRELEHCANCGRGVMHDGSQTFYRISLEYFLVMVGALRRQSGFEIAMGNPAIAAAMGPDEDMAKRIGDANRVIVCLDCSMRASIAEICEAINRREEARSVAQGEKGKPPLGEARATSGQSHASAGESPREPALPHSVEGNWQ